MNISIIGNLTPQDDYTHPIEQASNFAESALFHYAGYDREGRLLGGIIRVGNRPNEGFAECTVLLWLPDGSAVFNFRRIEITGNDNWCVGDWKIETIEPGGLLFRTRYRGLATFLADPRLMLDPKVAFKEPKVRLEFDLHHAGKAPLTEFEHHRPIDDAREAERFGTGGMQQLMSCWGSIRVDDEAPYEIKGFGWRDHNWGPRNWQGFTEHIFLTGNFGLEQGFSLYKTLDGHGYYFHRGVDEIIRVNKLTIDADYVDDTPEPAKVRVLVELENGKNHEITGRRVGYMPLRNHRAEMQTTIGYSLWEHVLDGQIEGFGHGEFLTQSWAQNGTEYYPG
jgi:hypothetical protein